MHYSFGPALGRRAVQEREFKRVELLLVDKYVAGSATHSCGSRGTQMIGQRDGRLRLRAVLCRESQVPHRAGSLLRSGL